MYCLPPLDPVHAVIFLASQAIDPTRAIAGQGARLTHILRQNWKPVSTGDSDHASCRPNGTTLTHQQLA